MGALQWLIAHWQPTTVSTWVDSISSQNGRIVLSGMGKSGLVAQKIASTFASTGSPSLFMHPAEALHGDLGMVTPGDSVLLLSNSGETEEILRILPSLSRLGIPIAAITSKTESSLGQAARWCFSYQLPDGEGCPIDLAPMASTTMQLIWGDVLAACLMRRKGFTAERFAELHPGGSLGAKLLKIKDLMHNLFPIVEPDATLIETLQIISNGKLGMAVVLDGYKLKGVISDGDIRRALERAQNQGINPLHLKAAEILSGHAPYTISPARLAVEAAAEMEAHKITFLIVVDQAKPCGVIHIHDLLKAKIL
jgi:arabinose-5-phosphate isomerase